MIALSNYFRRLVSYPQTPESKRAVYQFFGWTLALSWLLSVSVPDRILSNHEWARAFCDFMASFIPQIDRVTRAKFGSGINLSENNRFYFSVMWAVSPVYIFVTWRLMAAEKRYSAILVKLTFERFLKQLFLVSLALFVFFVLPVVGEFGDVKWWQRLMLGVPFFRGFLSPILVFAPAMIFTIFVYYLKEGLLEELRNWRSNWRNPHG